MYSLYKRTCTGMPPNSGSWTSTVDDTCCMAQRGQLKPIIAKRKYHTDGNTKRLMPRLTLADPCQHDPQLLEHLTRRHRRMHRRMQRAQAQTH
jgi:hypothetical protein